MYHQVPNHPQAKEGVVDLSEWSFKDNQTITLDGEWSFYPDQLISPNGIIAGDDNRTISVPRSWENELNKETQHTYGKGTYHLKVILPNKHQQLYGIRIKNVTTAANVYINGILYKEFNEVGLNNSGKPMERGPFSTFFQPEGNELDIVIQVSNYEIPFFGGITNSIQIGTGQAIQSEEGFSTTLQIVVSVIYLLHFMYVIILYFIGNKKYKKELICYGLMLLLASLTILIDDNIVVQLPIDVESSFKLLLLIMVSTLYVMLLFVKHLFQLQARSFKVLTAGFIIIVAGELLVPFEHFLYLGFFVLLYYVIAIGFMFNHTIRAVQQGYPDGIFILLLITSYTSNAIWGAGIKFGSLDIGYYPFDFIISIVVVAILLFKRHFRLVKLADEQNKQLQIEDQRKDEFLANTSHELRNPLHAILNITQVLLDKNKDTLSDENEERLLLQLRIGQQMTHTLNDLIDATRLKEQRIQLKKESHSLFNLASGTMNMVHFMIQEKNVQFEMDIPSSFPNVVVDEIRFVQILFNLLHNAIKYTDEGTITISAEQKGDLAWIHIKDTGIGISSDLQQRIFQPYEQASTSNHSSGGIGLGLSICKQLVELHGGEIYVSSVVGKGSTFSFSLPITKADSTRNIEKVELLENTKDLLETTQKNAESLNPPSGNILIVDDDPINLKLLQALLEDDYNIHAVTNAKEALENIHLRPWDLVISDVMMPNMSGYELTEKIREQFEISELPILLLTARNQIEDISSGFEYGANDYITKPIDSLELKMRVKALVKLKLSIQELLRFEAAWLQAQIQPHFLFNTLNTIASLSEIDTERMIKVLEQFGNYLRKSFHVHNTKSVIPLKDELSLVRSYLYIEKERFGDRLQVEWKVSNEGLDSIKIPPLSIQPLVENAVRHGVLRQRNGGKITIQITKSAGRIHVAIIDNGVGIKKDNIQELLSEHQINMNGVGIPNTNRRLIQLYGEGLTIESEPEIGTKISFHVPR
ncbi:ATP-binding protein [Gracilibacillus halotolerans]